MGVGEHRLGRDDGIRGIRDDEGGKEDGYPSAGGPSRLGVDVICDSIFAFGKERRRGGCVLFQFGVHW